MTGPLRPETESQLRDAVAGAIADGAALELVGRATKRGYGRPMQTARTLDLSALTGVREYEAAELVLTAGAGTPLAEIETLLASQNQMLAFEPPDWSALLGADSAGTIGGTIACNLAGPRRVKSGAARDHFLGTIAVSGRGEVFKAGGKVVKNVTGYDLCKLLAGSFGTLAAMAEVSVKVMPAPAKSRTVLLFNLTPVEAIQVLSDALNSAYEVSGAAYLPPLVAARSQCDYVQRAGTSVTCFRVEGTPVSVEARCQALCASVSHLATLEELHTMNSAKLWREIRDVAPLLPDASKAIWRVSVPPHSGGIVAQAGGGEYFLDWGGGLVWLAVDASGDGHAAAIRAAVKQAGGGHASLLRAAAGLRAAVPVFEPQDAGTAALTARIKDGFDPQRVLNPGRMYPSV
jgi:glycolate oxidase FAD binding subunit